MVLNQGSFVSSKFLPLQLPLFVQAKQPFQEGKECLLCAAIHACCGRPSSGALDEQDVGNTAFCIITLPTLYSSSISGIN